MTSANESRSAPSREERRRQRATRPSAKSKTAAIGNNTIAVTSQRLSSVTRYCIAARTEPLPQNPLPNVRKSAATNERIIENGGFLGDEDLSDVIPRGLVTGCARPFPCGSGGEPPQRAQKSDRATRSLPSLTNRGSATARKR